MILTQKECDERFVKFVAGAYGGDGSDSTMAQAFDDLEAVVSFVVAKYYGGNMPLPAEIASMSFRDKAVWAMKEMTKRRSV